eukprot:TRINITY_DN3605_c0_g6_i1.p1 TRINITY_DN3605_c0_g6~~TRINITY_DN3605_c0_g6_i1.p1  ORF type:complete len:340 (-),score=55.34 TRINITY_DN3605_c0_g6_i1:105-1124(-)
MHRPSSGTSTRSRRDEVWEMKRQRFLSKQKGGGGYGGGGRPPQLGNLSQATAPPQAAPGSPLSKLVAEGYPTAPQNQASAHQPYGDRPSSGSMGGLKPSSRGSHGQQPAYGHGQLGGGQADGFSANIASQWNQNVQSNVMHGQNRHDPSVSGPGVRSGGQRVTQAPGGAANIDLSWPGGQQSGAGGRPPQMPGGNPGYGQAGCGSMGSYQGGGGAVGSYQAPAPTYGGQRGASPSGRSNGSYAAPWGRDDDQLQQPSRRAHQNHQSAAPFGVDNGSVGAGGRNMGGGRCGQPPSPQNYSNHPSYGGGAASALYGGGADVGSHRGGRGRPPGGSSQIVFG